MLIPLISVSLIGLVAGLSVAARQSPTVVLGRCLMAAWLGFGLGAGVGLVLGVFLPGAFWPSVVGHTIAVLATTRTANLSVPSTRRQVTA